MDLFAWCSFLVAVFSSVQAYRFARRGRHRAAILLLVLAALSLRANLSYRWWLSSWDERYHAVVARNLIDHPLRPTLVDQPFKEIPPSNWTSTHIWLHKRPLALWLMAGSMRVFGENEMALRLPSVIVASLGVLVIYAIALHFLSAGAALIAAAFYVWNARISELSAGFWATDHVDTLLIFLVSLGVLLSIKAADRLGREARAGWPLTLLTGLVLGLAYLTKSAPSLVILAVFFVSLLQKSKSWSLRLGAPALVLLVAFAINLPWELHTARAFPEAYAYESSYSLQRLTQEVEGHHEPWIFHFVILYRYFGYLAWIPLLLFFTQALRKERDWLPLVAWFVITYGMFTIAAMKMKSYVFIASPVIFCALGWFCAAAFGPKAELSRRMKQIYVAAALAVTITFLLTSSLKAHMPWKPPPRTKLWSEEVHYLASRMSALPKAKWLVFNAPSVNEARFYMRATPQGSVPGARELADAEARGFRTAIYGSREDPRLRSLATDPRVTFIPYDPRTLPARRIMRALKSRNLENALIFNAREREDLRRYLNRFALSVKVYSALPGKGLRFGRKLESGRPIVVLRQDDSKTPGPIPNEFAGATFLRTTRYAN